MKIVALVRTSPGTNYFVNQIHRLYKVDLAICEKMPPVIERLKKKFAESGAKASIDLGFENIFKKLTAKEDILKYRSIFRNGWSKLDKDIKLETVEDINSPDTRDLLEDLRPDILIVRGTSIIKSHTIMHIPLVLNLHAGLSPYYRGTHCSEWALINWDAYNIGSTLHKVAPNIDGGDILGQVRIEIEPHDNVTSIEAKMCVQGTKILIDALRFLEAGKNLFYHKQDLSMGYLTLQRQWSVYCSKLIKYIERNGLIAKMLKTPSRGKLPIVQLSTEK